MSIAKIIGDRIRAYRNQKGWSQEYLAEKAEVHHTYIGQLERGEKNATIESISRFFILIPPYFNFNIEIKKCQKSDY